MVSDQEIVKGVETLLRQSDPTAVTSLNGVVQQLEAKLGQDLSHKAGFIRDQISLLLCARPTPTLSPNPLKDHFAFHQQQQQHPQLFAHATPQFASHFSFQQHHPQFAPQDLNFGQPQPLPASHFQSQTQPQVVKHELLPQNVAPIAVPQMPKESVPVGAKRRGGPGGLNKVCSVSPALQAIVGEPALPRTEIVKQLWAYIRKNSLQDPSNKRKIICDDALRVVFETDCTDMFKMNKLLAKHITPLEPSKESGQAKRLKVDAECTTVSAEPAASPVIISEALAKFFGSEGREMLPAEAEKRVWEYIKVNHLEDPSNPMVVLCDDKLHELLGCESISVMGIREMLLRHHLFRNS